MRKKNIYKKILNSGIQFKVVSITNLKNKLEKILKKEFNLSAQGLDEWADNYLSVLRDNLKCIIEYPYIDKVYRDDYYSYISSKFGTTPRNAIRISFFAKPLTLEHFENPNKDSIQKKFYGFVIIRPTEPLSSGRSLIHPNAFKKTGFRICSTKYQISIYGLKLDAIGFPHASQDGESMQCAETSAWTIIEYFSSKYLGYRPLLPSQIRRILAKKSEERQLPSSGLYEDQISYVLKKLGFGTKIYEREKYAGLEKDFFRILSYYIESGIPVLVGIENKEKKFGHEVIIIGHIEPKKYSIKNCNPIYDNNAIKIYDTADAKKSYVFIDDNFPPYQISDPQKLEYLNSDPDWKGSKIASFVVPLYSKVYNEAEQAKFIALSVINNNYYELKNIGRELIFRFFLTSSRSFKESILYNDEFNSSMKELKEIILKMSMPRFIWVAEITNEENYNKTNALEMIIIDATEPNFNSHSVLLTIGNQCVIVNLDGKYERLGEIEIQPFSMYTKNLSTFLTIK